jgi:predicted transcriptional regulator
MTNPDHYEDDCPNHPVLTVLEVAGKVLVGLALATVAATAVAAYASARAGQKAGEYLDEAAEDADRTIRNAGNQLAVTARAAVESLAGVEERRGEVSAV